MLISVWAQNWFPLYISCSSGGTGKTELEKPLIERMGCFLRLKTKSTHQFWRSANLSSVSIWFGPFKWLFFWNCLVLTPALCLCAWPLNDHSLQYKLSEQPVPNPWFVITEPAHSYYLGIFWQNSWLVLIIILYLKYASGFCRKLFSF